MTQSPLTRSLLAGLATVCLLAACASAPDSRRATESLPEPPAKADIPRLVQARMELAGAYFQRGQNATALQEVNAAIQADPSQVSGYSLRGLILAAMGDAVHAEESFQQALRRASQDADTLHNYGWFLCQQRRYADADQQFALALQVPGYQDAPRTMLVQGICQARNQRWADAERTLGKAYEYDAGNPAVGYNLAEVLYRRGEHERARFYIRRVNQIDEQVTPQSLWLAIRIERALGQGAQVQQLGQQLNNRFPSASEASLYQRGRFDD